MFVKLKMDGLCEKCPCSELFWSVFSRIRNEYGEILRVSHSFFAFIPSGALFPFEVTGFIGKTLVEKAKPISIKYIF